MTATIKGDNKDEFELTWVSSCENSINTVLQFLKHLFHHKL